MDSTVLITGANRGIGLEFARQYAGDGWSVYGTARQPGDAETLRGLEGDVDILEVDVTDPGTIESARESLENELEGLDLLINNAGIMGSKDAFGDLDAGAVRRVFEVNCLGAFRVTQSVRSLLEQASGTAAFVTSLLGSIEDNRSGGSYPYRISKAALNMFVKTLSEEVSYADLSVVLLHPGWVQTRMGGSDASITPETSVSGMRNVLETLDRDDHGRFVSYEGEELPW